MRKYRKIFLIQVIFIILIFTVFLYAKTTEETNLERNRTDVAENITQAIKELDLKGYTIIIHTNDSHGRVVPDASSGQMGFTAVSALKKSYEAAGAEVLLLDAGDTLHGTSYASRDNGKNIISLMNLIGYDAMVPGNNDFNYGTDTLLERAGEMNFTLLSANIRYKSDENNLLKDHIMITKNGVKYAIVGLTTTDTEAMQYPTNINTINFNNPVTSAKEQVQALEVEGAEFVIALMHMGVDDNSEFTSKIIAQKVEGIDLIVDGHSHTAFEDGLIVKNTLIVSAGEYIENIGVVTIAPDGSRKAELFSASNFTGTDPVVNNYLEGYNEEK